MKNYAQKWYKNFDFPLFLTFFILVIFGVVMVYSASIAWAVHRATPLEPTYFYKKQLLHAILAMIVFFIFSFFPYWKFRSLKGTGIFMVVSLFLLVTVLVTGVAAGTSRRWFSLAGFTMQPAEVMKIALIVYLSAFFARRNEKGNIQQLNRSLTPPLLVIFAATILIIIQPDLGSAMIVFSIGIAIIMASGIGYKTVFKLIGGVVGALSLAILMAYLILGDKLLTENRLGRITSFVNPFEDAQNTGLQVVNGYIAIGLGGLKGVGLGNSIQKMGYLPEPHTDFIMAIVAEELGAFGVLIVVGGIGFIVYRAMRIALTTKDTLARLITVGIATLLSVQTFLNLGGLTGLIPLTGVPLPFISYGGTSIILLSLSIGILMNISMFHKVVQQK